MLDRDLLIRLLVGHTGGVASQSTSKIDGQECCLQCVRCSGFTVLFIYHVADIAIWVGIVLVTDAEVVIMLV